MSTTNSSRRRPVEHRAREEGQSPDYKDELEEDREEEQSHEEGQDYEGRRDREEGQN